MELHNNIDFQNEFDFNKPDSAGKYSKERRKALKMLKETSRTFYIPISRLPAGLLEAVGSGYLCMRAIDEIEDHPALDRKSKVKLLRNISYTIQSSDDRLREEELIFDAPQFSTFLPKVSLHLSEWMALAPREIASRIWDATATMADRMACWVEDGFKIQSEADLDCYTMSVAGAVGLLLSDLWAWFDGTQTNRSNAVGFGRGLQAVNILRNRYQDLKRGVDFFPDGWGEKNMVQYARQNLALADYYLDELAKGPVFDFCRMPLTLAYATIDALENGREKLDRNEVIRLLELE